MTTNTHERPEWRDYPELIVTNDPAVPEHIEGWLQRQRANRVAEARLTLNHDHARREHVAHLATAAAPSAPLLPRRRSLWGIVANVALATLAVLAVIGAFALMRGLLGGP